MVIYNFKKIKAIPEAMDFVDIVLTRTQRKTPTIIHPNFKITRIRSFYRRKVKFTEETCNEKLSQIIEDFPVIDVSKKSLNSVFWGAFFFSFCFLWSSISFFFFFRPPLTNHLFYIFCLSISLLI